MDKNYSTHLQLAFKTRITLVIFGFFLFFILLETGLRLGGGVLLSMQEYRNKQTLKQKGAYRILCLGESTTAGQYPAFLEESLNRRNTGIKFSVIDKGIGGATTADILGRLEYNIDKYRPDMVITMMGINDWGEHIPYEAATTSKSTLFFRSFRTYKLARLLWLHILTKAKEIRLYKPKKDRQHSGGIFPGIRLKEAYAESVSTEDRFREAIALNPKNDDVYVKLGWFYRNQGKFSQAEGAFKKAIELNPKNNYAYSGLGWLYRNQNKFSQAEETFRKAIALNPKNDDVYVKLGWFYRNQGNFSQAEGAFKKAIELNPKDDPAYFGLGWLYEHQSKLSQGEDIFKKAVELNPKNANAYFALGRVYQLQGKFSQAEETFRKAIELNPKDDHTYFELGRVYQLQGKFSQAEDLFKKAIELHPENDSIYGALLVLYEEMGKPELAKEYAEKANTARLRYYKPVTVNNYRKLKEILDKKGIRLVCMQYPMRSIEPLKKMFEGDKKGIIFVDNEKIFRDAVKKEGCRAYFTDMFAGDFGHCIPRGNKLLAENIANTILREVFGNLTR